MNIARQQQILSLIKRIISTELREINHELFHSVVVTHVLLSNDGRECRIWVDASDEVVDLLNEKYLRELQRAFMKKFARKVVPHLIFLKEDRQIERMDALLDKDREQG